MSHRADRSFFDEKRPWSRRKDQILDDYLAPYLAKVAWLRRPILLVDAFAGPGRFRDGSRGSPLILCDRARERISGGESELARSIESFPFAHARCGTFLATIDEIESRVRSAKASVFLYVDPFRVTDLSWEEMDRVFRLVHDDRSVEVLINFNGAQLARIGRARISKRIAPDDADPIGVALDPHTNLASLDRIVGGSWWHEIMTRELDFADEVEAILDGMCERLRERFAEVVRFDVKVDWRHGVPKYSLLFGSRHRDALRLMNDFIAKGRKEWAAESEPSQKTLFETRSEEIVPRPASELVDEILATASRRRPRDELALEVIRRRPGVYSQTDIRRVITSRLKDGRLRSQTGKTRIAGTVDVWRP